MEIDPIQSVHFFVPMKTTTIIRSLFAGVFSLLFVAASHAQISRSLTIQAPPMVRAGTYLTVSVSAATSATDGEQVGFLHWEYSLNNGASWSPINYDVNLGTSATRSFTFAAGGSAGTIRVRARAAYRFGGAGDVDYNGGSINWGGSWDNWGAPPSREVAIPVFTQLSYSQLPIGSNGNRYLPRSDDGEANARNLSEVAQSLAANHTSGKVIEFETGIYEFNINPTGWIGFANVGNLTLIGRGDARGGGEKTVLKWQHPANPHTGGFMFFDSNCRNITIQNLMFDWHFGNPRRRADGTHLIVQGKHFTIHRNYFTNAPDWAVTVGAHQQLSANAADDPEYIFFTENDFKHNLGDGLHVLWGSQIYVVGNNFYENGDDHIALHNDLYNWSGSPGQGKIPSFCYLLSNQLGLTGFHAMRITSVSDTTIDGNTIYRTAHNGIHVSNTIAYPDTANNVPGVYGPQVQRLTLTHNTVSTNNNANTNDVAFHLGLLDGTFFYYQYAIPINLEAYNASNSTIGPNP